MKNSSKQLTAPQIVKKLQVKYKGKNCSFKYPGYDIVYGLIDEIYLEVLREPIVVIQMNNKRYTCSLESIHDCLNLLQYDTHVLANI